MIMPETILTDAALEDALAAPSEQDIESLRHLDDDLLILGVGGKMGPSLARRALRALRAAGSKRRVLAVARFSSPELAEELRADGIETIAADLLRIDQIQALPAVGNVIYMAARKFGTSGEESLTWATNAYLPGLVADRFRGARIAAWSTGNVYPLTPVAGAGPTEQDPVGPIGEYAQSALARERMFEYGARTHSTRVAILRLNYAVELRYGVLVEIARKVLAGEPVDLTMSAVNVIWQGDANSVCLRSLPYAATPPFVLNLTSPEAYRVREIAERFGRRLGREPVFSGAESEVALLNNAGRCREMFGEPAVSLDRMMEWVAAWLERGGTLWNKPTHFQVRNGRF